MATTDTVRTAATVYFAARRIISELPIHRDTVLSHARDVDRAANELDGIEKLRARIARRASSGADTSQELAMIESALESAAWHATTFHKVALAAIDWAESSLSLLGDTDTPEMQFPAVHAVWGAVALLSDALKGATRESPPRHNEHPIDEHAIRAVVADQKWTIDRIRKVLPDETLVPLRKRADDEWVLAKMNAANKPNVGGGDPASEKPDGGEKNQDLESPIDPNRKPLRLPEVLAFKAAQLAESIAGKRLQDAEAHKNLKDDPITEQALSGDAELKGYELPSLKTFRRYLSTARTFFGCPRKMPTRGRSGRSLVRLDGSRSDQ